jgi:SAM-dependent methyltransferase
MLLADPDCPTLTRFDDKDIGFVSLEMGGFIVHASLPEPVLIAAAMLAPGVAELDFSGYYRVGPVTSALSPQTASKPGRQATLIPAWPASLPLSSHVDWRPWPWLRGLDPFILMVHSYQGEMCPVVGDLARPVTDQALGSWLQGLPDLDVSKRSLEDPVVILTCPPGARQPLADRVGRLVLFPEDGEVTVGVEPVELADRAAEVMMMVCLHCTEDGRGGRFTSVYPQGSAGDRVRWAYRCRFRSNPARWLVERSAVPGFIAPAALRPQLFGGERFCGLSYFDRRDRESRSSALNAPLLGSSHVAWTPNDAYQPGTPAEIDPATGTMRAAAQPWHSRDLGELPFDVEEVAVAVGYFAEGLFAVYDERQDISYWETPSAFGRRVKQDLEAVLAKASARRRAPPRLVLLTDYAAVPATVRREVARGIGGAELITVNAPSSLSLDQRPGRAGPQACIALLPGNGRAALPVWTSTNSEGVSKTLSPAPAPRAGHQPNGVPTRAGGDSDVPAPAPPLVRRQTAVGPPQTVGRRAADRAPEGGTGPSRVAAAQLSRHPATQLASRQPRRHRPATRQLARLPGSARLVAAAARKTAYGWFLVPGRDGAAQARLLAQAAARLRVLPGITVIAAHYSAQLGGFDAQRQPLTLTALAAGLPFLPGWVPGQPVFLLACRPPDATDADYQASAAALGSEVTTGRADLWYLPRTGTLFSAPAHLTRHGARPGRNVGFASYPASGAPPVIYRAALPAQPTGQAPGARRLTMPVRFGDSPTPARQRPGPQAGGSSAAGPSSAEGREPGVARTGTAQPGTAQPTTAQPVPGHGGGQARRTTRAGWAWRVLRFLCLPFSRRGNVTGDSATAAQTSQGLVPPSAGQAAQQPPDTASRPAVSTPDLPQAAASAQSASAQRQPASPAGGDGQQDGQQGGGSGWAGYYAWTAGRGPRPLLVAACNALGEGRGRTAFDLGCGEGTDTLELLARGWSVTAIDNDPGGLDLLRARIPPPAADRISLVQTSFTDVELSDAHLIHAGFSLPFTPPSDFPALWANIRRALVPGGIFAGQLFGNEDDWAATPGMTFHTREEIDRLLAAMEIIRLTEFKEDGPSGGGLKHWHVFHILARNPEIGGARTGTPPGDPAHRPAH